MRPEVCRLHRRKSILYETNLILARHSFRRANLAIEAVEVVPSQRAAMTAELLADEERRPAIVYTPTRAWSLNRDFWLVQYDVAIVLFHE